MKAFRWALGSRYMAVVSTALVGTLVTVAAFLLVCSWEYRVAEIDFQSRARSYLEVINADLGDASTLLYTIAAFIGSNDHPVTEPEFARFSASLHRRVSGLRDTAWAPHVTLAQRPEFERDARAAGAAGYQILQFGPRHKLIRAPARSEYYALLFIEAGGAKRPLLGVDLIAEKVRARAALRALRTREPAATPPTDVVTVKQPGAGVLSYMPVYSSWRGHGAGPHAAAGLVLGVFDVHTLVERILARNASTVGLDLYLFNPAARSDRRVLYRTEGSANGGPSLTEAALLLGAHWQSTVLLIDQHLGAIVTPSRPLQIVRWSLFSGTTLFVGLTMTAMSVAYLLVLLRRTLQLETLTTSLHATTLTLHENNEQVTRLSRHDALTGMPNRLFFRERIDQAVARSHRNMPFSLLFLDLDRFKSINDTLGHGAGDQLLVAVAERINASVRDADTAARLGGDEFAIILADVADSATISTFANRLINDISRPYTINSQLVVIGVSVGAAIATPDATAEGLVAEADLAMYAAKDAGRGTFRVFEERLRAHVDLKRLLENDLRGALERNELEVHYQPLMHLLDNRVSSFEALVRWNHPIRGMIPPDEFIPVAEECGLIGQLGLWVLLTACKAAAGWPQPVKVAVNVSPVQFKDTALLTNILDCLAISGLAPQRLELELTEAAVLERAGPTIALLRHLRTLGVSVAFDDFGTGYSSLSSLLRFPFDKIKVDRSFIADVETSPSAAAIVQALVRLGAGLNLVTTAEGIETPAQLEQLRACGCTEAQGYLFSPARPNAEVPRLLRELSARAGTGFPLTL